MSTCYECGLNECDCPPINVHWDAEKFAALIAEAEARGYQRAIDALRDENRFMRWLIDYHLEHPDDRRHSCEFYVAYLEASAQTAIRSGESTDEQ